MPIISEPKDKPWLTWPIKLPDVKWPSLGDAVKNTLIDWFKDIAKTFISQTKPSVVLDTKEEVAKKSLDPDMFDDPDVRKFVVDLKDKWKKPGTDVSALGNDLFLIAKGYAAALQFKSLTGKDYIPGGTDTEKPEQIGENLFEAIRFVTNVCVLSNILSMIGQCIPLTQLTDLGREIRSYLDYSGLTQVTGFGYGMMLSAALSPILTQEVNEHMRNTPLDLRTLIDLKHRGYEEGFDFGLGMAKLGYSDKNKDAIVKSAEYLPSPSEVVLWAAREVFEKDIRKTLRLDEKFPEDFWIYAEKAGMTREMAENFWAQHWTFPGFTTIQEMRWRNIITDKEVEIFFHEADIVPYWREAMLKVMYNPYTRVDGRRMYEVGILSRDQFKTAMTDIGYTEERAENLAKWATERKLAPEKDLTISKIEKAFRDGEITGDNYIERIKDMGYDDSEALLLLNLLKRDIEEKEEKDQIDWYVLRYKNGLIDQDELTKFLEGLGLNEAKKNKMILQAKNAKASLAKTASKSDLDKWYKQDIITQEVYKTRLEGLGYEDSDIENYVESLNLEIGG